LRASRPDWAQPLPQSYTYVPIQNPDNDPNDPNAGYLSVVSPLPLETATDAQRLEAITLTGNFSVSSINYDGTGAVLRSVNPSSHGPRLLSRQVLYEEDFQVAIMPRRVMRFWAVVRRDLCDCRSAAAQCRRPALARTRLCASAAFSTRRTRRSMTFTGTAATVPSSGWTTRGRR